MRAFVGNPVPEVHVSPGQRHRRFQPSLNLQSPKAQGNLLSDRIASGTQAATSASSVQSGRWTFPSQTLLAPLQQSLQSPLDAIGELYTLALVADPTTRISKEKQQFNVQFGHALRTLREDIPEFFSHPQRMDIFTDDVVFLDTIGPRLGLGRTKVEGKSRYSRHLWALRLLAALVFCQCEVEVQRFWQRSEQTVAVRWVLHGRPRLLNAVVGASARLDGISEFKFNGKGYIYQHTVDCINWEGLRLGLRQQELRQQVMKVAGLCFRDLAA